MTVAPTFRHYAGSDAEAIVDSVNVPLYVSCHPDADPFHSAARHRERALGYVKAPGFGQVVAYIDNEPVAQAFGYTLPPNARWWEGLVTDHDNGFTVETGRRTFALNELMVRPEFEGRGIAYATHAELMRSRNEERATLLVDPDNDRAQTLYARLGYAKVGKLQPFPDSPNFDALILPLPLAP